MKSKFKWLIGLILVSITAISIFYYPSVKQYRTRRFIEKYLTDILTYCEYFDIPETAYMSVIYAERLHNINEFDRADFTRAYLGFDASVGFGQIKISTAEWLETHYEELFPFSISANRTALIDRLYSPDTNIAYSVLYCRVIYNHFYEKYGVFPDVASLSSYYSRGIDYGRTIHDKYYLNSLGMTAYEVFKEHFDTGL
jgi:hypothetical protein